MPSGPSETANHQNDFRPFSPAGRCGHRLRHLHARPGRARGQLECRRRTAEGLFGRRSHWPALLAVLCRGGSAQQSTRPASRGSAAERPCGDRGLAHAQGRLALLCLGGPPQDRRSARPSYRLCQGDPRHHGAEAGAGGAARERAPVPPACGGRHRLCDLHARSERHRRQLEPERGAAEGLYGG